MHAADTQYSRSFRRALTGIEVGQEITPPPLLPELSARETVSIYDPERLSPELAELAAEAAPEIPKVLSHPLALKTERMLASGEESERKLMVPKIQFLSRLVLTFFFPTLAGPFSPYKEMLYLLRPDSGMSSFATSSFPYSGLRNSSHE